MKRIAILALLVTALPITSIAHAQEAIQEAADANDPRLPKRLILIWDPVERKLDGTPTGRIFQVPSGWQLCDGTNGTPNLASRFIKGVKSLSDAGQTGGRADIPTQGAHQHSRLQIRRNGFGDDNADNTFGNTPDGGHNHGSINEPPFYTLAYICRYRS